MWLIVGLGNPGSKYLMTRHNLGFMAVDYIVQGVGANNEAAKREHNAVTLSFNWEKTPVKLVKPETFMNLSGDSVSALKNFYKIPDENILILHDELDLPLGRIQIKTSGGDGGHNGVASVIEKLGTDQFLRIRIGIGRPAIAGMEPSAWVLKDFSKEEKAELPDLLNRVVDAVEAVIFDGTTKAMNEFNRKD